MKLLPYVAVMALLLSACGPAEEDPQDNVEPIDTTAVVVCSWPGYVPFPSGYGYDENTAALQAAVDTRDLAYLREHSWRLWAGIMQPDTSIGWPLWFTWPGNTETFTNPSGSGLGATNTPAVSLIGKNVDNKSIIPDLPSDSLPLYPLPDSVTITYGDSGVISNGAIAYGKNFLFNGDIMIPTESLSEEGYCWIRDNSLYLRDTLNKKYENYLAGHGPHILDAPQRYIVTKHMYWPVKGDGYTALPVWKDYHDASYDGYAGYETWTDWVAIDPTNGSNEIAEVEVEYLYGVYKNAVHPNTPIGPQKQMAPVHDINEFYSHKITVDEWWYTLNVNDRAIINASANWAYNRNFIPGHDYLVTMAMHVNTKEIPTWALQSVWWSDTPDEGPYAANRPTDIGQAQGPWDHYLMTNAFGIPAEAGGSELPMSMNPYIELVIHVVGTDCNNCHIRAGWPAGAGIDSASYQNPNCADLLMKLTPDSTCLKNYLLTDFQWIISDNAK